VNKNVITAAAFAGGVVVGSGVTYLIVHKRANKKAQREWEEFANEEIKNVKDTYKLLRKEPPYDNPATAVKAYIERLDELQYLSEHAEEAAIQAANEAAEEAVEEAEERVEEFVEAVEAYEEEHDSDFIITDEEAEAAQDPVVKNIFDEARRHIAERESARDPETFDALKNRDARAPFHISTDDFMDDENEFSKITITYFEGDDTLIDERESIIPDIDGTVGRDNLHHFGEDSDSKDTVYVRNEKLQTDFEVVREEGTYTQMVLGVRDFKDNRPKIRKMRDDE
jgi:type IV secretory pathway VirB10-like protein